MARQKTLEQTKHFKWLVKNYSKFPSNEVLACKLNERIKKEYEIEFAKCTINYIKAQSAQELILSISKIDNLKPIVVTPRMVQYYASQYRLRKSPEAMSIKNSANSSRPRKHKEYELIVSFTDWFRSVSLGMEKDGRLRSASLIPGFRSSLSRWNKEEGSQIGIQIKSVIIDRSSALVRIIALNAKNK